MVMTNVQLYLAIGVPTLVNAVLVTVLIMYMNAKFEAVNSKLDERFQGVYQRFAGIDQRFDDMRDLWRAELHRVEEVLDARLKHLEEQ